MTTSPTTHWADALKLRPEVHSSDGSVGDLQMSLHKAVHQTVNVPYRKVSYYGDITQPTPNLVGFFARVARRLGTDADGRALFHLDQGMGGGKSHALVGLWHMAANPEGFFATDLGRQVRTEAARGASEVDLSGTITITLTADYFSPGATSEVFGPATTLFERFVWALVGGDMDRYERYVAAGPNKGTLQQAFADARRPVLILLDELMDYVLALADAAHIDTMPGEKAFLNALMDACDDVPRVAFVVVMIRSELDERGYPPAALDFRDYVAARLVRNGQTDPVTEAQDFSAIIRRRLFELPEGDVVVRDLTRRYAAAADATWRTQVFDKLGPDRGVAGFEERAAASFPFHPELMRLVREEWSQVSGFQRVRSTVAIFARTALHWVTEHHNGSWAPPLIGVGDIPLTVALEQLLSSGLLLGNDRAIQGYRAVANTDITSTDGSSGRAVAVDEALGRDGVAITQPSPAVRMATALLCYSIVGRPQGRRGATKAELLLAVFGPAGAQAPYPAAEEVFNKLTGDDGLGALEVTTPANAPARYHLSIKQTLRMYFTAAMALVPPPLRGALVWEVAQKLAVKGSFDALLAIEAPADAAAPLERAFEGVDSDQTRLVLLDPRRWTLLNGRDSTSRQDITALLGLGDHPLRVDNAASCVVACVNTQRRDIALKRAAEVLAWREVVKQLSVDTEDELREANRAHDELMTKLRRDVERAYQHYAYLVRAEGDLHVEFKRFDDDTRSALNGGHMWAALVQAGRATQPEGLSGTYLEALLDDFDRLLTPREIVQAFYKNPGFPLVTSTDEVRRVLFELVANDWQLVDVDDEPLSISSPGQISIGSISQRLRRAPLAPLGGSAPASDEDLLTSHDQTGRPTHSGTADQTSAPPSPAAPPAGPTVYKRYRLQLSNRSITSSETREQAWQLLRELAKVIDTATIADHQLLTMDLTLVTAEGQQGAIEAKAETLGAQVHVEDDDF